MACRSKAIWKSNPAPFSLWSWWMEAASSCRFWPGGCRSAFYPRGWGVWRTSAADKVSKELFFALLFCVEITRVPVSVCVCVCCLCFLFLFFFCFFFFFLSFFLSFFFVLSFNFPASFLYRSQLKTTLVACYTNIAHGQLKLAAEYRNLKDIPKERLHASYALSACDQALARDASSVKVSIQIYSFWNKNKKTPPSHSSRLFPVICSQQLFAISKGLFRRGCANHHLQEFDMAVADLKAAARFVLFWFFVFFFCFILLFCFLVCFCFALLCFVLFACLYVHKCALEKKWKSRTVCFLKIFPPC